MFAQFLLFVAVAFYPSTTVPVVVSLRLSFPAVLSSQSLLITQIFLFLLLLIFNSLRPPFHSLNFYVKKVVTDNCRSVYFTRLMRYFKLSVDF